MGILGFGAAFVLANWGIAASTATNAALLIVVEPVALMLLGPALLGERLTAREAVGAALAVAGAVLVVIDGVPGVTQRLVPHWRGDLLLILSALAYASYSLLGRRVLVRHEARRVTASSILWGAVAMLPLALGEWLAGQRPVWTGAAVAGALYLGVVVTALGYLVWNWALRRGGAPRAAIFLCLQPPAGGGVRGGLPNQPPAALPPVGRGAI